MRGKSIIIGCILLALVSLSTTANARVHFGPLFAVLIVPQDDFGDARHTDFLVGGSAFFPLLSHFGFVVEGGAWVDRFNHFGETKTDITLLLGGGGRFYPLPGKLGIFDPYISVTAGLDLDLGDIRLPPMPLYIRFNLGSSINVKGMRIIPYIEGGLLLEGMSDDRILVINITTGFLL